jgi:hypothetical protein
MHKRDNDQVAVWVDCPEPPKAEAEAIRALAFIMGDAIAALEVASGGHETSVFPWKAVVAAPVSRQSAGLVVLWLSSIGVHAFIDDGDYTFE